LRRWGEVQRACLGGQILKESSGKPNAESGVSAALAIFIHYGGKVWQQQQEQQQQAWAQGLSDQRHGAGAGAGAGRASERACSSQSGWRGLFTCQQEQQRSEKVTEERTHA